jgi:hypothetical protein
MCTKYSLQTLVKLVVIECVIVVLCMGILLHLDLDYALGVKHNISLIYKYTMRS